MTPLDLSELHHPPFVGGHLDRYRNWLLCRAISRQLTTQYNKLGFGQIKADIKLKTHIHRWERMLIRIV